MRKKPCFVLLSLPSFSDIRKICPAFSPGSWQRFSPIYPLPLLFRRPATLPPLKAPQAFFSPSAFFLYWQRKAHALLAETAPSALSKGKPCAFRPQMFWKPRMLSIKKSMTPFSTSYSGTNLFFCKICLYRETTEAVRDQILPSSFILEYRICSTDTPFHLPLI